MKLTFDPATEAFRAEFLAWLEANLPPFDVAIAARPRSTADIPPWAREWQRTLFEAGWLVPGNPPRFGGRDASLLEQFVHRQEMIRHGVDASFNPQSLGIVVPSILSFGTEEQKVQWALPLLRAEWTAALGMSEPNAGSDLAALTTRAALEGDHFVVNGQKVWTSGAHDADVLLAFVRTDPDAPRHAGISALIIPTDLAGITRRPFGSIAAADELDFNEVFFDNVCVPAANLLGDLHGGWKVATGSLGHERAMLWLDYSGRLDQFLDTFAVELRDAGLDDDLTAEWFGGVAMDAQALKLLGHRTLAKTQRGVPSAEQSILKLVGSEAIHRAFAHAVDALGPDALDHTVRPGSPMPYQLDSYTDSWFNRYVRSFAGTIAGGTSEIQRNIVAERVLGLPR